MQGPRPRHELPHFRYHPDPVSTGAIEAIADLECPCCGLCTGWAYATEPYGLGDQPANLCPWCIADGSAARKFGSEFVGDIEGEVPASVEEELNLRTPGYLSWHCERWQICCGDACAYLGPVGWDRLKDMPDAQAAILDDGWPEDVLPDITENGAVIGGYLFRCLHCGAHRAHADAA